MTWTKEKDEALCKEILLIEPFRYRPRTKESGNAWSQVAEDLNQIKSLQMNVDQRAVRDRFKIIRSHFLHKMRDEESASGISPEMTPVDEALDDIIEREKEFERQHTQEDGAKTAKAEKDRKTGEEMRQESLETFAETRKRKIENGEEDASEAPKVRKNRRSGADTLVYLKEKADQEMEYKKEELALKIKVHEAQVAEQKAMRQQQSETTEALANVQQALLKQIQQHAEAQQEQQQQNNQFMLMMMKMMQNMKNK